MGEVRRPLKIRWKEQRVGGAQKSEAEPSAPSPLPALIAPTGQLTWGPESEGGGRASYAKKRCLTKAPRSLRKLRSGK